MLSMGHARSLLGINDISTQLNLSRKVIKRKLSVRDLEKIVQNFKEKHKSDGKILPLKDYLLTTLETNLSRHLATKVSIKKKYNSSGKLEIFFHSNEELMRLLELLGYSEDFS
jgi:ParB family chromosome partitioning protein